MSTHLQNDYLQYVCVCVSLAATCISVMTGACVLFAHFSPIISSSHTLLIDGPIKFFGVGKNGLMMDDYGLDDLIDVSLAGDLVLAVWCGHECGAEADGQVVRVHHVLVTVLGQAGDG